MKRTLFLFIFFAVFSLLISKVDINTGSLSELKSLPISEEQAEKILIAYYVLNFYDNE